MYVANTIYYDIERDTYEEGCIGGGASRSTSWPIDLKFDNLPDLIKAIAEHVGVGVKDCEPDACSEPGRMDCSRMETADGNEPTPEQYTAWKKGEFDLYYATYTAFIKKITPVSLIGAL